MNIVRTPIEHYSKQGSYEKSLKGQGSTKSWPPRSACHSGLQKLAWLVLRLPAPETYLAPVGLEVGPDRARRPARFSSHIHASGGQATVSRFLDPHKAPVAQLPRFRTSCWAQPLLPSWA